MVIFALGTFLTLCSWGRPYRLRELARAPEKGRLPERVLARALLLRGRVPEQAQALLVRGPVPERVPERVLEQAPDRLRVDPNSA